MNWPVLIPIAIAVLALIVFLVWRNLKDEKQFEDQVKQNYPKSKDEEGDIEIDQKMQ